MEYVSAVLGAFMATWTQARRTFGEGAPSPGATFDQSASLRQLRAQAEAANPDRHWSGGGANAYSAVNVEHAERIGRVAELDQQLAAQVDRSAEIVSAGRHRLDAVRDWVTAAAASVPAGPAGDQILVPIARQGLGRIAGIVESSNAELGLIGAEIQRLAGEYSMLGESPVKTAPPGDVADEDGKKRLEEILEKYRVREDPGGTHKFDFPWIVDKIAGKELPDQELTQTEIEMLLADPTRILPIMDIREQATAEAKVRFPPPSGREIDNQTDAFRHAYGSALMTQKFGEDWTALFTAAHEGRENNYQASESMDLYNNEVGRNIALANPDASPEELADLVAHSVENGDMVVIGPDGQGLEWSDSGLPIGDSSKSPAGPDDRGAPLPSPYPNVGGS